MFTEPNGTNGHGRGNGQRPRNLYSRRVAELHRAVLDCVSREQIEAIIQALLERAASGDIAAAKLVFAYVAGRPS